MDEHRDIGNGHISPPRMHFGPKHGWLRYAPFMSRAFRSQAYVQTGRLWGERGVVLTCHTHNENQSEKATACVFFLIMFVHDCPSALEGPNKMSHCCQPCHRPDPPWRCHGYSHPQAVVGSMRSYGQATLAQLVQPSNMMFDVPSCVLPEAQGYRPGMDNSC